MTDARAIWLHASVLLLALWVAFTCHLPRLGDGSSGFDAERAHVELSENIAAEPHEIIDVAAKKRLRDHLLARFGELAEGFPEVDGRHASVDVQFGTMSRREHLDDEERESFDEFEIHYPLENLLLHVPGRRSDGALLLAAHYDSEFETTGAGDDGSACAAWLEVLRVLALDGAPERDLLLLLTDGEEQGLLGAKLFQEQRREAAADENAIWNLPLIGALNFEAIGNDGRSILFQTGPESGAFLEAYRRVVAQPIGSSLAPWIYDQLPNDTDLTVFRGMDLPGLNFAIVGGGSAYHQPFDRPENLPLETLSHQGETMLALVREITTLDEFRAPTPAFQDVGGSTFVTFDPRIGEWLARIAVFGGLVLLLFGGRGGRLRRLGLGLVGGLLHGLVAILVVQLSIGAVVMLGEVVAPLLGIDEVARGNRTSTTLVLLASVTVAVAAWRWMRELPLADERTLGALVLIAFVAKALAQAAPEGAHVLAVPVLAGLAATWVLRGDELAGWRHVVGAALSGLALLASLAVLPSLAHVLSTDPSAARTLGALLAVFAAVAVGPSLERVAPRKLATIVGVAGLGLGLIAGLLQAAGA